MRIVCPLVSNVQFRAGLRKNEVGGHDTLIHSRVGITVKKKKTLDGYSKSFDNKLN